MGGSGFQLAPNEILNRFIQGTQEREELEQRQKENQYKQDMIELHHKEIDASVKHLNNLTEVARQNLKDQVADRIGQGRIPGAFAQGIPQGAAQPQTPGQIPTQARTLPNGIQVPAVPGTQSPTQDLGPAQQVPIGYGTPGTPSYLGPEEYSSPQALMALEAQRVKTLGAASSQVAGQTEQAKAQAEFPTKMKEIEAMHAYVQDKDIRDRASMERVAAANNLTHIQATQIMANAHIQAARLNQGANPDVINAITQQVTNGVDLETVAKNMKLGRGQIAAWEAANSGTITPLNKDQSKVLTSVGGLYAPGGPVDKMEDFAKHYSADTQLGASVKKILLVPRAKWDAQQAAIMSEYESMQAETVKIGRAIAGDENLRASALFKEQGEKLLPDLKYNSAENAKRVQRFKTEASGLVKNKLSSLPQSDLQRYAAQKNIPLDVASPSTGAVNSTSGKINVIRRSDKQTGTIDAKDFNPALYERR